MAGEPRNVRRRGHRAADARSDPLAEGGFREIFRGVQRRRREIRAANRPEADCVMFTRDELSFCAVCRRAIEAILDLHSR
jgi:hypothetical protein